MNTEIPSSKPVCNHRVLRKQEKAISNVVVIGGPNKTA